MKFKQSTMALEPPEIKPVEYKRKAASTMRLFRSKKARDVAELQWRLSTPLATILLALLGVPLSRTAPRQGKYAKMGTAVLIYAVYYNTSAMAKKWVDQGVVGSMPGYVVGKCFAGQPDTDPAIAAKLCLSVAQPMAPLSGLNPYWKFMGQ